MVSSTIAFPVTLLFTFSITCAWTSRSELYGPKYKPVWEKGARTKYTTNFGPGAVRDMIESAGLGYENYTVRTDDDYLININRIVHPDKVGKSDKGYPLLLLNGLFIQSEGWLIQQMMDSNMAPVWSALGYDVWMGDQRGTVRSRGHVTLDADRDKQYWDHATEEIGLYDTSSFIDFVLKKTGRENLVIVCVSFGCSMHSALIDARPEYNQKISGAFYFNPLVNNIRNQLKMAFQHLSLLINADMIVKAYEHRGIYEISPRLPAVKKELFHLCAPFTNLIIPIAKTIDRGHLHVPKSVCMQIASCIGGSSVKGIKHVLQMYSHGDFAKFDYGREENLKRYGQDIPPLYNLTKITSFVAVYYSDADGYSTTEGVQRTLKSLGGPTYECLMPGFNHIDVAAGTTFKYILPDVNAVLDSLTGNSDDTRKAKSGKCPSMEWVRRLEN